MRVQTDHFDIYFDESTEKLVPRMAYFLEEAWKDVGQLYNYYVPTRTPFLFYSNHNEFEQTNIVPIGEGTGGVTEAFKNRLVIFNDGSEEWLRHVIYHEFVHVVQFSILYGGFWKSVRLLKSPFYPLWLMEGTAEYGAGEIDAAMGDMVVRDAVAHDQLPFLAELQGFGHLKPNQVTLGYKTGEAAIDFFEDEYGKEKLEQLLPTVKDFFDVSSALQQLAGLDLSRFDFRFHEWMKDKYRDLMARAHDPAHYGIRLTQSDGIPQFNESPVISMDGNTLYYFSDRGGPTQLYKKDLKTGESQPLIGLKWSAFENLHIRQRSLSLSHDGKTLAFAGEKEQSDFLYLFNLDRKRLKRVRVPFDEIRSPVFSPNRDVLVCVGMRRGYNDLYLMDRRGRILERLTNSPQDERSPVFSADGARVIFSGEVLSIERADPAGWDLFSLTISDKNMQRLTELIGSETEPEALPDGSVLFVRDRDDNGHYGFNLWKWDPSGEYRQLTDFVGGGFSPRYSPVSGTLFFVGFDAGEKHLYQSSGTLTEAVTVSSRQLTEVPENISEDIVANGDPPRVAKASSQPALLWPSNQEDSLLFGAPRPYRFKASTDLFLPFFLYSTQDGLVLVDIWQFSELMGNHQFQQQMQYASGNDFIDLAMFYTYARFRPQFTLGVRADKYYQDFDRQQQRREVSAIGIATYPLDRINSISVGVGGEDQRDSFLDESRSNYALHDRFWAAFFSHDTITGRYLVPTKGRRLDLFYQQGMAAVEGDQLYKSGGLEAVQYVPLPRESTFASRLFYGRSTGENVQVFRLGGADRIRALSSGSLDHKKSNVAFVSAEMRLRIKYLNARTRFLFPDFFFKAAYLNFFNDFGYGWNNEQERNEFKPRTANNSMGIGISWPTFILQTFQIHFSIVWSRQTTSHSDIWYVTAGPSF